MTDRRRATEAGLGVRFRLLVVAVLSLALLFGIAPFAQPGVEAASPRVAIIVGPVGGLTASYRADAEKAAAEARRWTDDVVTVYSPNATWSAAKAAMTGASVVIYLGHGNGFPSRYGSTLNPRTQNGLGLNPVAGEGNGTHQYFGESYLARQVRLAPDAVVILSHLCYASGNSEPGLPEGSLDDSRQRVDNFAAGFLAAGASAVIADAFLNPAWYVRSIFSGKGTIERIWRRAPNFHDNVIAFPSTRTPGLTALLDPTRPRSLFYRSLVTKAELRAEEVARGARLRPVVEAPVDEAAPPARVGPAVTAARLHGLPIAGTTAELRLAFSSSGTEEPGDLGVGVRWVPIELRPAEPEATAPPAAASPAPAAASPAAASPDPDPAAPSAAPALEPQPASPAASDASGSLARPASPEPSGEPAAPATPALEPPPDPARGLVAAEDPGAVVMLAPSRATAKGARVAVEVPARPGLYRLVTTLHDGDGVAFDAATQQRVPALVVRVTASLSARIAVADRIATTAGAHVELPVAVLNSGTIAWVDAATGPLDYEEAPASNAAPPSAFVVAQWLRLDPPGGAPLPDVVRERLAAAPGETGRVVLRLTAPDVVGTYLVVLDVVSPLRGSLVASGEAPALIRVTVGSPPASPRPDFAPTPEFVPAPELLDPAPDPSQGAAPGAAQDPVVPAADPAAPDAAAPTPSAPDPAATDAAPAANSAPNPAGSAEAPAAGL